jgi:hypothetical protein
MSDATVVAIPHAVILGVKLQIGYAIPVAEADELQRQPAEA